LKIDSEDYKTTFVLLKAKRANTGVYKVTAKNTSGIDEVEVEISVLSKPSKPKGPLKVSDVTSEGCKLKWDKPEDDGGEPIDHYVVERMDTETGRWVPVVTSKTPEAELNILYHGWFSPGIVPAPTCSVALFTSDLAVFGATTSVAGLNEGKEYQFRVKAVNAEGESEPLETEIPTLAKNPYS
ncbi:unnamed protein product, partial [Timema podura]|nr:unnamed protein product [Timema podura]